MRTAAMAQGSDSRVGLVIPTLNAGERWREALAAIGSQSQQLARRLVIDSSSSDATADLARAADFEVKTIQRAEFNHGGTRQAAVEQLSDCDIVVFLTQDAILLGEDSIATLVQTFEDPTVAVAYGRQVPHIGANAIEAHSRMFNYGTISYRKDTAAIRELGPKAYFCSNSFAGYSSKTLKMLGGFRRDLIFAEDAEYAARAIQAGFANVYCADALVRHSHDYTVRQQLGRYFDLGVFEACTVALRREFGTHSAEGVRFVVSELRYLSHKAPWEIPRAVAQTLAKFLGYRLGRAQWLPLSIKRRISLSPGYWTKRD